MGKSLNRDQRKNGNKYMTRETGRKLKEQQQFIAYSGGEKKPKIKAKFKPRSEEDYD